LIVDAGAGENWLEATDVVKFVFFTSKQDISKSLRNIFSILFVKFTISCTFAHPFFKGKTRSLTKQRI